MGPVERSVRWEMVGKNAFIGMEQAYAMFGEFLQVLASLSISTP